MLNPVQTCIGQTDGTDRYVIIEPIIAAAGEAGLHSTGVFKIYKDVYENQTHLITEPAERGDLNDDLPDEHNPDYLGKFIGQLHYEHVNIILS